MQRATLGVWRYQRAADLYAIDPGRLSIRSVTAGAALIVGSALAFALDGPVAQAAYRQGLDPAAFGFWRALAGALVLGGFLATRPRSGVLAGIRGMRRAAVIRLALAAGAGLGLNLALFQAFARLPVAVAVAAFGCYPLLIAAWEATSRHRRRRRPGRAGLIPPQRKRTCVTLATSAPDRKAWMPRSCRSMCMVAASTSYEAASTQIKLQHGWCRCD